MGSINNAGRVFACTLKRLAACWLLLTSFCPTGHGQSTDSTTTAIYEAALSRLDSLAAGDGSFKEAVFTTENAYFNNGLNREVFDKYIHNLVQLSAIWSRYNRIQHYNFEDSLNFQANFSLYAVLKDTIRIVDSAHNSAYFVPFTYDFSDYDGQNNWANMFVSKLLVSRKGNCHSLPYLYKILADEIGARCWLALAPNHIYIKNQSDKIGWYNSELTSGSFPNDGWMMASGYLPLQAVQNRIYMDTLSRRQAVALCMLDLAKGYSHHAKQSGSEFIIRCCDHSLKLFPLNVQAMLLKAETLKSDYVAQTVKRPAQYAEMEGLYGRLYDLGYREMPQKMYLDWLGSIEKQKSKYTNHQVDALHSK